MRIILPQTVTTGALLASNVATDDAPAWNSATAYSVGAVVVANLRLWEALTAHTNKPPATNSTGDAADWLDLGPINRWRMFARSIGSRTTGAGAIPVINAVNAEDDLTGIGVSIAISETINAVALLDVNGLFADVILADAEGARVYERRVSLSGAMPESDWYWYFTAPIDRLRETALFDLPSIPGTLRVAVHQPSGVAAIGVLVIGKQAEMGRAVHGARLGIQDYSRKERDEFGNIDVTERLFARTANVDVFFPFPFTSRIHRTLSDIRATPVVWEVSPMVGASLIYGFWRDFSIVLETPTYVTATIEIEGLT